MHRRWLVVAVFVLLAGCSRTPTNVVNDVASAIGATNLKTIHYSGTGTAYILGQSWRPGDPWPGRELKSYSRLIDYESGSWRDEAVLIQGNFPPRGGGGTPLVGEQRRVSALSGKYAWNRTGNRNPTPAPAAVNERRLQIWLTPHGWVKAAMAATTTMESKTVDGKQLTVISFTANEKNKVNGFVNDQNLLEKVETWLPHPVLGDMLVETSYSDYRDFGGIQFPAKIRQEQGGFPTFELTVSDVKVNPAVSIEVPEQVKQSPPPAVRVESQKVADGVWFISGGSLNTVAVEFNDFVTVVEGPLNEARSLAVIGEVKKLIPNKPIRYLVNTHYHFDHSGGVRTYVAEGATIVTHEMNKPFYEQAWQAPRTLEPDKLSRNPKAVTFETVTEKHVITDGSRTMELYRVQDDPHNAGMLVAYLPKEKLLVSADVYSNIPPAPNAPPRRPTPSHENFYEYLTRLRLDVQRFLPIHGRVATMADFQRYFGRKE